MRTAQAEQAKACADAAAEGAIADLEVAWALAAAAVKPPSGRANAEGDSESAGAQIE